MSDSAAPPAQELSEEKKKEVIETYQNLRAAIQQLYGKISELDSDLSEHNLVLSQIRDLNADRRCWNQVGDVLVETQIGEVAPKLDATRAQIEEALSKLKAEVDKNEKDLEALVQEYNIQDKTLDQPAA
mmetsp:Transcript_7829/g.19414  ORF Transcript_7829/g.19414 Transcript_7829/m.19414 type:complete len:129 (+) Transcript_7829:83-469(+)